MREPRTIFACTIKRKHHCSTHPCESPFVDGGHHTKESRLYYLRLLHNRVIQYHTKRHHTTQLNTTVLAIRRTHFAGLPFFWKLIRKVYDDSKCICVLCLCVCTHII